MQVSTLSISHVHVHDFEASTPCCFCLSRTQNAEAAARVEGEVVAAVEADAVGYVGDGHSDHEDEHGQKKEDPKRRYAGIVGVCW